MDDYSADPNHEFSDLLKLAATELRLRAEIRARELLREMDKNKGARGNPAPIVQSHDATAEPKLSDIGVTKTLSSRWQQGPSSSSSSWRSTPA